MLIVWGTMIRRKPRGTAPHFCPVCRALRTCAASGVYRVGHVYYIPMGSKTHVLDELTCPECKSLYAVHPRSVTKGSEPATNAQAALGALLPDEAEPLRVRLAFETRLDSGQLTESDRLALIAEPILCLSYEHEVSQTKGWDKSLTSLLTLLLILCSLPTIVLWSIFTQPRHDAYIFPLAIVSSAVTVSLLGYVVRRAHATGRRIASKRFVPRLADSLRPLKPRPEELESAIDSLRSRGNKLAASLDVPELALAIHSPTWHRAAA